MKETLVTPTKNGRLQRDLLVMLQPSFPGITVAVGPDERWNRMCVVFRWPGFAELLPEERFQRLATVIPEEFRKDRLAGFVWLELAPDETVDAFLELPRSEDVAKREGLIYAGLVQAGLFEALTRALGPATAKNCPGDFSTLAAILARRSYPDHQIREAKLAFIRHGAYCDCQALWLARHALAELYDDVA